MTIAPDRHEEVVRPSGGDLATQSAADVAACADAVLDTTDAPRASVSFCARSRATKVWSHTPHPPPAGRNGTTIFTGSWRAGLREGRPEPRYQREGAAARRRGRSISKFSFWVPFHCSRSGGISAHRASGEPRGSKRAQKSAAERHRGLLPRPRPRQELRARGCGGALTGEGRGEPASPGIHFAAIQPPAAGSSAGTNPESGASPPTGAAPEQRRS